MGERDQQRFLRACISASVKKTTKPIPTLKAYTLQGYKTRERDRQTDREELMMAKPQRLKQNQGHLDKTLQNIT